MIVTHRISRLYAQCLLPCQSALFFLPDVVDFDLLLDKMAALLNAEMWLSMIARLLKVKKNFFLLTSPNNDKITK